MQLFHIAIVTSFPDTTVSKTYKYLTGSPGLEIRKPKIFKSLVLDAVISLILLPLAALQWSRIY